MTGNYLRDVALAACPDLGCRRRKVCGKLGINGNCLKTNFASHDDWCIYIAAKINKFMAGLPVRERDPNAPELTTNDAMANLRKAFDERVIELRAQEQRSHNQSVR